jgi:DNA replication protein DnaC
VLRSVPGPGSEEPAPDTPACALGICDGSGWLLQENDTTVACACREGMIGRAQSRGMGTGIPKRFRGVSFDRRPVCDIDPFVLRPVRVFVEQISTRLDEGDGLWFMGDVGTGKTSLAMLVAAKAEQASRSIAIYSVPRLLSEIRDTYNRESGPSYMALFRKLCAVDLLLLDDLGTETRTDWVQEQLYAIVNERWQEERSILVTSNVSDRDKLREQFGTRTVSRLTEMCEALPLHGADLRERST